MGVPSQGGPDDRDFLASLRNLEFVVSSRNMMNSRSQGCRNRFFQPENLLSIELQRLDKLSLLGRRIFQVRSRSEHTFES
jgi:hypothetical protein